MLSTLLMDEELDCGEEAAHASGALINPNTSRLEYLLLRGPGGAELVAPLNLLEQRPGGGLRVILAPARLPAMPDPAAAAPPAQGTLPSNLGDLCLARANTPVLAEPETPIGPLRGLGLDADFHIRLVLTAAHPDPVPVERVARYSTDALTVILEK